MVSVNLLPVGIQAAKRRNRRVRLWLSAGIAVGVVAAVPLALDISKTATAASLAARLAPLEQRLEEVRGSLKTVAIEREVLTGQIARADALRGKRSWSALLTLLATRSPDSVWLTALRTPTLGPQQTSATSAAATAKNAQPQSVTLGGPSGIHLEGYALDHEALYGFMSALKDTKVFQRVELTSAGKEPVLTGMAVRFVLECYW